MLVDGSHLTSALFYLPSVLRCSALGCCCRSVGEYASQLEGNTQGPELVKGFFKELETLDAQLREVRRGEGEGEGPGAATAS